MKVECGNCNTRYNIDASKIPEKGASATCKKCGSRMVIKKPAPVKKADRHCPKCGSPIAEDAAECLICGVVISKYKNPPAAKTSEPAEESRFTISPPQEAEHNDPPPQPEAGNGQIEINQILGIVGAAILFVGVFLPLISAPLFGSVNYVQNGRGDGWIIIILAAFSLVLALKKSYKWLMATGGCSLAVMAFTFIMLQIKLSEQKAQMETELAGNPFRALADAAMQSIQFQWGWAVLIIGAACIISAAILKPNPIR